MIEKSEMRGKISFHFAFMKFRKLLIDETF